MRKRVALLTALFLFSFALAIGTPADAGNFFNPPAVAEPGTWYAGETPQNLNPSYPVILFVQGLNSSSHTWYENNDMYQTAFNNGYQTAFVELYDSGGTSEDMWDNGALLADQIAEISQAFQKPLVLVTHSKGGIDAEAALVHYGAYRYVTNVVTLSSPHYGSQLADLAYSAWAGWLAGILGAKSDATYSLQTSYMNYFRSVTDSSPNAGRTPFYTLAGNSWGSFGSSLYWGGLYLSQYGANDGAVTVSNAYHPSSTMVKVGGWNHSTIKYGSSTFSWFRNYLTAAPATISRLNVSSAASIPDRSISNETKGDFLIRGGEAQGNASEVLPVEEGVTKLTIDWMSNQPMTEITLHTPEGKVMKLPVQTTSDEEIFKGALHHSVSLSNPMPGEWKVNAAASSPYAYLMLAQYTSPLSDQVKVKKSADGQLFMKNGGKAKGKVSYTLDFTPLHQKGKQKGTKRVKGGAILSGDKLTLQNKDPGAYVYTFEMEGLTEKGHPFHRTLIQSFFVDDRGRVY